jgi:prophage regulatory protein
MTILQLSRLPRVLEQRGDSRSNLYRDIDAGMWTRPVSLGPRYSAWPQHEVDALVSARIAGCSNDEIRALVRALEAQRKQMAPSIDAGTAPAAA